MLERWREAWQRRALEAYMSYYADDFRGDNLDRKGWAAHKGKVFASVGELKIGIDGLSVRVTGDAAVAEFDQAYQTRALNQRGRKRLELIRSAAGWKIRRESFQRTP